MKIVVIEKADGSVVTITPAQNPVAGSPAAQRKDETDGAYFERLVAGAVADESAAGGARVIDMDHTALPAGHQHFKASRRWDGAAVFVDMVEARKTKTDRIRVERDRRLAQEDIESLKAIEEKDAARQAAVAVRKQALRDLPETIQPELDAIADAEALHAYEPTWP